jgi:hypothetical protein
MTMSSSKTRIEVASPPSVCSRHTNPGLASASALMGSRLATNSYDCGESSGAGDAEPEDHASVLRFRRPN